MEGGLNSLPYRRAVPPSAFRAASRLYRCPRMMPRLCSAAFGHISNLKLQGSGFGCCQFATRLMASFRASVGGLGLWYVGCCGWFVFVRNIDLLMFLFSLSEILVLSSRRCWMLVGLLGWSLTWSVLGASGNRIFTSDGSIGAWLLGVSIVSSTVKSDGWFGGGTDGGAVGSLRWSLV